MHRNEIHKRLALACAEVVIDWLGGWAGGERPEGLTKAAALVSRAIKSVERHIPDRSVRELEMDREYQKALRKAVRRIGHTPGDHYDIEAMIAAALAACEQVQDDGRIRKHMGADERISWADLTVGLQRLLEAINPEMDGPQMRFEIAEAVTG